MSFRRFTNFTLVVLIVAAVLPLAAQTDTKPAKVEVFTGYSWITTDAEINGSKGVSPVPVTFQLKDAKGGFLVDISYFFNKWVGLTVDTGAHFGDKYDADEVFIGPTLRFPGEHIQPFIHGLGGWSRVAPGNQVENDGFGFALGGGLDLRVSRHVSIRLLQADYVRSKHNYNFSIPNPDTIEGARLAGGLVFLAGVGEELPVSATCSVDKAEVWAGEPVKASVSPRNFNPKHKLQYDWTTNGGKVEGQGDAVSINTTGVAEGQSYSVSVHVTDPKNKKAVTSCQASFATKKRLPPTISCSANPNSIVQGAGSISIHADASSPQGGPVTVAIQSNCGVTGQGTDTTVDSANIQPGTCNVTCTVTDDHQLTASSSTSFTVQPKPLPPPPPPPPPSLALRSVYFATAQPTPKHPDGGLVKSQQQTLIGIAADFNKYLAIKPDARLTLEAHADPRGGEAYNQKLTERRAARVKSFLAEHGVPADHIDTVALGQQHQLTAAEVKEQVDSNPELTPGEKKRILRNERTIVLANNRRVDIKLNAPGVPAQESVHRYPWNAEDALSLIGGREKPATAPKVRPNKPRGRKPRATGGNKKKKG